MGVNRNARKSLDLCNDAARLCRKLGVGNELTPGPSHPNRERSEMLDETSALAERAKIMANNLEGERRSYLASARLNYGAVRVMSIGSSVAGVAAALLVDKT